MALKQYLGPADPLRSAESQNKGARWLTVLTLPLIALVFWWALSPEVKNGAGAALTSLTETTQSAATKPVAVEPTTIVCGEGYQELPENVAQVVITIPPTGEKCWTPWLTRPRSARNFISNPRGDIRVKKAYADKSEAEVDDSPLADQPLDSKFITARRYQNRGTAPVKVIITF